MTPRLTAPAPMRSGPVTVRLIRVSDAGRLQQLLRENRAWLETWEATLPGTQLEPPGSFPLKGAIRSLRRQVRRAVGLPYVVELDGRLVGQVSIADIAWGAIRSAQIGYWVAEDAAGRGVIPTAVRLIMDDAFSRIGLHRIEICMRPENDASRRVVEKLGMRYEGRRLRYIHIDGAWRDHDCYALTAEEWPTSFGAPR